MNDETPAIATQTVFLVWSPAKRMRTNKHKLLCFSFTVMNDHDGTTGRRNPRKDTAQETQ
jgi:hypothetical protein